MNAGRAPSRFPEGTRTLCHCGHIAIASGCTTGFGYDARKSRYCFDCCGVRDEGAMLKRGKATLYLTDKGITNWPGTLSFPARYIKRGRHNIAGTRTDVWFNVLDGHVWHGVQYGENTQILHATRTVERWRQ